MIEIRHYLTADAKDIYVDWLRQLRDPIAKVQIVKRINRVDSAILGTTSSARMV